MNARRTRRGAGRWRVRPVWTRPPTGPEEDDWLTHWAAHADAPRALAFEGESWSYGRWLAEAADRAGRLAGQGVRAGDRVAAAIGPGLEYAAWLMAAQHLRAVWLPLHLRAAPPELAHVLSMAGARLVVWDEAHRAIAEGAARLAGAAAAGAGRLAPGEAPDRPARIALTHVQGIVATSGTTGVPKAAMLTYGNHLHSAIASAARLGTGAGDRHLACLPLYHVGGMAVLWRGLIGGQTAVILPRFDAAEVNRLIDRGEVTVVSVVAQTLSCMLEDHAGRPYPGTVRAVLAGGGPVPLSLMRRALDLRLPVAATYGLTETASQAATAVPGDLPEEEGAAGTPLPGVFVRVAAAPGAVGEIRVRGPIVTPGYWARPLATRRAIRRGWLLTGDVGRIAADGSLIVLDRRRDLIVSGGENIYPAEVEAALLSCPGVAEAGVLAVPDATWGQIPAALVVPGPRGAPSAADLFACLAERLAPYKRPRHIRAVAALPRTASGKLRRIDLPAMWRAAAPLGAGPAGPEADHDR